MTPQEQLDEFLKDLKKINKNFDPDKSKLKTLIAKLEEGIGEVKLKKRKTPRALEASDENKELGKEADQYKDALNIIYAIWGSDQSYDEAKSKAAAKAVLPSSTLKLKAGGGSAKDLVKRQKAKLEELGELFVADYVTFKHLLTVPEPVMKGRGTAHSSEYLQKAQLAANSAASAGKVTLKTLQSVYDNTVLAKAAICTTFAFAAAYLLSEGQRAGKNPRVEVIAHNAKSGFAGTHLFVLVGRPTDTKLDKSATWMDSTIVVDTWAASLGKALIYDPATTFKVSPIAKEADKLTSFFDSSQPD